uniref:Inhibitor of apoptosis-promoting Bax1 n=1 Tax=viral metagenome TaxID=1070528 RepID=A0A6C0BB99_9ZZZZ
MLKLFLKKKEFLLAVFANLIVQLGITYWTMMHYPLYKKNNTMFFVYIILQFAIIFALVLVPMPMIVKFILFSFFSFIWGILFSMYREIPFYNDLIQFSIASTAAIFLSMFLVGVLLLFMGIHLGIRFAFVLFFALLFLITAQLLDMFSLHWLSGVSVVLFALYIIYDTNIILQRDYRGDFINASLDYFLNTINIFLSFMNNQ